MQRRQSQTKGGQQEYGTVAPLQFDLEKTLKQASERKKLLDLANEQISKIRHQLRLGGSQESFDELTILLNGYTRLKKVVERIK